MGTMYKCTACRFEFLSGHSHHTGSSDAICLDCGTQYQIQPASDWGPEAGEKCVLLKVIPSGGKTPREGLVKCKQFVLARRSAASVTIDGQDSHFVHYETQPLHCEHCRKSGTIETDLKAETICPRCKKETLKDLGIVQY